MKAKRFGSADYFKITILGFALAALWQSMHTIILPLRLLDFVAESEKNTYLGMLKPNMGNKPALHYIGLRREVV